MLITLTYLTASVRTRMHCQNKVCEVSEMHLTPADMPHDIQHQMLTSAADWSMPPHAVTPLTVQAYHKAEREVCRASAVVAAQRIATRVHAGALCSSLLAQSPCRTCHMCQQRRPRCVCGQYSTPERWPASQVQFRPQVQKHAAAIVHPGAAHLCRSPCRCHRRSPCLPWTMVKT